MKKFVIDTFIMLGLLLVVNIGLDMYVSNRLQHSRDKLLAGWNDIIHTDIHADMVIVGSSRAMMHYNPRIIDSLLHVNSYNLGYDGSPLHRQYAKYMAYLTYQPTPQYMILNIDHFSLRYEKGYERESFFPYMLNLPIRDVIIENQEFSWGELYIPNYRYLVNGGDAYFIKHYDCDFPLYKGFWGRDLVWGTELFEKLPDSIEAEIDNRSIKALENILEQANKYQTRVIFCHAPLYRECADRIVNKEEYMSIFRVYADKYDIPILDYTYSELSNDTIWFYNYTHLNKKGANAFTKILVHDIDSIIHKNL